jgi:hypothetical protein
MILGSQQIKNDTHCRQLLRFNTGTNLLIDSAKSSIGTITTAGGGTTTYQYSTTSKLGSRSLDCNAMTNRRWQGFPSLAFDLIKLPLYVSYWIYPVSIPAVDATPISFYTNITNRISFRVTTENKNLVSVYSGTTTAQTLVHPFIMSNGNWYYIQYLFTPSTTYLGVNGTIVETNINFPTGTDKNYRVICGTSTDTYRASPELLDEFMWSEGVGISPAQLTVDKLRES